MAFGAKTNERPGTRASVQHLHVSAYKAREVLDLIRNKHVADADEILQFVERDVAIAIRKVLASAVANAQNNDGQDPETLYVSACFADEGPTMKRWRPRARGRATRIRKRTTHITIIVSRMAERELTQRAAKAATPGRATRRTVAGATQARQARVARSRQRDADKAGISDDDATTTTEADTTDEAAEHTGDIKGNRDSMKYHVPGSQWYEQTDAEEWFDTVEEAEAAGYEPAGGEAKQHVDDDADTKDEK